jgi:molybdopterin/thiamine biosynthesis adenylyltransferase
MDTFFRQADILGLDDLEGFDVDIVGAGSLGGAILLCLGKMGFGIRNRLTVTDFDRCEAHNLATQWFAPGHVLLNRPKVEAMSEMMAWVCDREITTVQSRFTGQETRAVGPVVILAVDSLEERRRIWPRLKRRDDVRLLLDARMGAEVLEVYCVDLPPQKSSAAYEASLETDGEPFREPCTRRAILYTALGAAAVVGSLLRAYTRGEVFPRHVVFDFRNFFLEVGPSAAPASE